MLIAFWEFGVLADFLEELKHTWVSFFYFLFWSSVVWKNPWVTIRMEIDNKSELILVILDELFQRLSFFLRKCSSSSVAFSTRISTFIFGSMSIVLSISISPGKTVIPIEIDTRVFRSTFSLIITFCITKWFDCIRVLILSFFQHFFCFSEIFFNQCKTISIHDWNDMVHILLK